MYTSHFRQLKITCSWPWITLLTPSHLLHLSRLMRAKGGKPSLIPQDWQTDARPSFIPLPFPLKTPFAGCAWNILHIITAPDVGCIHQYVWLMEPVMPRQRFASNNMTEVFKGGNSEMCGGSHAKQSELLISIDRSLF